MLKSDHRVQELGNFGSRARSAVDVQRYHCPALEAPLRKRKQES
jgi:hypothetical protein